MAEAEHNFDLVDRFFIDQGQLAGLSSELAFVLGVEWAMFRHELVTAQNPFEYLVHKDNVERILHLCWGHKRKAQAVFTDDPEWVTIEVAG